ncbi:aspartate-semialdehyde dehydrogenase [Actinomycetota bacterium]
MRLSTPARPTLAVVGATGAVGRTALSILGMREDLWGEIRLAAALEDVGITLTVRGEELVVQELTPEFFDGVQVAMFDIPPEVTREWAEIAAARGVVVVDNGTALRRDPDVPLIVTEVNPRKVADRPRGIVANPGAGTLTIIDVLAVLHSGWELTELVVNSYQAASGAGMAGVRRLYDELAVVGGERSLGQSPGDVRRHIEHEIGRTDVFPAPLAMNVIPWIGTHAGDGWTTEEVKIRHEVRKILGIPDLKVSATCVRVPVITTHSAAVHATFANRIPVKAARQALIEAPAVVVLDDPEVPDFPTPSDIVGADPRFVGRLRQAMDFPHTLEFFICGDNLRKGSALNMVQTAELIHSELTS